MLNSIIQFLIIYGRPVAYSSMAVYYIVMTILAIVRHK